MDFMIRHNIEVFSHYMRSAHNITADGLTRWADQEIMEWLHRERTWQVDVPPEWIQELTLVDGEDDMAYHMARIRGRLMDFLRDGRNRVCEWRPGCYTTASLMWDWRAPCWAYGILRPEIFAKLDFRVRLKAPEGDIFLLIGCAYSQLEIDDFKRDVSFIRPRYAILVTPSWVQDLRNPSEFWSCRRSVDSASVGDLCSAPRWIYGCGPPDSHFDFSPFMRDIRVLHHGYTDAGIPCAEDPEGVSRIVGIPNSIGRKVTIRIEGGGIQMSRFPHCPMPITEVFRGASALWPLVSPEMRIPYICEKLVILGGHPGLGRENGIDHEVADLMMKSYYPRSTARRAMAAVLLHYEEGLYTVNTFHDVGRAGSTRLSMASSGDYFQDLLTRTFGADRMGAILSGIAPSTRSRYTTGWKHWQMFMVNQGKSPWIVRADPQWGDNLIDFLMFESEIIGNAAPTISGKVSAIRFLHVIVGYPDFALGGGRYRQVLKALKRESIKCNANYR